MAKNNKTRFFYVLYSDKTRVFDQSERAYYPIYIINVNNTIKKILTALAWVVLGNIGPRSWQYGPHFARSVLPRPRANIPQYGPRARLVSG